MTNFEWMRVRLGTRAGILSSKEVSRIWSSFYEDLKKSEWSDRFEKLMRTRLLMGALRYGRMGVDGKPVYDRLKGIQKRLGEYKETGNTETLVDVANLALLEFVEGKHEKAHFSSMDGNHSCTES